MGTMVDLSKWQPKPNISVNGIIMNEDLLNRIFNIISNGTDFNILHLTETKDLIRKEIANYVSYPKSNMLSLRGKGTTYTIFKEDRFPEEVFQRFANIHEGIISENNIVIKEDEEDDEYIMQNTLDDVVQSFDWFTLTAEEKFKRGEQEILKGIVNMVQ